MLAVSLPINLPLSEITDLTPFDDIIDKIHFVVANAIAGKNHNSFTSNPQQLHYILHEQLKGFLHSQLSVPTFRTP